MYNDIEHDIVTLDLPNIVYAFPKGHKRDITILPFLHPLILKIAKARPNWRLVGCGYMGHPVEMGIAANSFAVFEGGVELGSIARDYKYYSSSAHDVFVISNARIRGKRRRGREVQTKCIKKAFKTVTSEFYTKTTTELVAESANVIHRAVSTAVHAPYQKYTRNRRAIEDAAVSFGLSDWEQFSKFARGQGVPSVHLDTYHEDMQEYEDVAKLSSKHSKQETTWVILRGSEYIITQNNSTEIFSSEQLSPYMKRAVGMLKLAEVGTFIPNIGVKATPDTLLIMPQEG